MSETPQTRECYLMNDNEIRLKFKELVQRNNSLYDQLLAARAVLAQCKEALKSFSQCEPIIFNNIDPKDCWLWKPHQTSRECQGISVQHILDSKLALEAIRKLEETK